MIWPSFLSRTRVAERLQTPCPAEARARSMPTMLPLGRSLTRSLVLSRIPPLALPPTVTLSSVPIGLVEVAPKPSVETEVPPTAPLPAVPPVAADPAEPVVEAPEPAVETLAGDAVAGAPETPP